MTRFLLAAFAAVSLSAASPVLAACQDCKSCPHGAAAKPAAAKPAAEEAAAEKTAKTPPCACAGEGKPCQCGAQCTCPHCDSRKAGAKKAPPEKT